MTSYIHQQGRGYVTLCGLMMSPFVQTTYWPEAPTCQRCRAHLGLPDTLAERKSTGGAGREK